MLPTLSISYTTTMLRVLGKDLTELQHAGIIGAPQPNPRFQTAVPRIRTAQYCVWLGSKNERSHSGTRNFFSYLRVAQSHSQVYGFLESSFRHPWFVSQ